ncbi:MAG: hypothetical protein ACI8RZ_002989 [Myxococcota bacterium]|jgi:hypothetical protein
MLRAVGVLLLILTAGLAWLTLGDRMSPMALSVVEWESQIGLPLAPITGFAGIIALALGFRTRKKSPAPTPSRPQTHAPGVKPTISPTAKDWVSDVIGRAQALTLEDGASIKLDVGSDIPFTLHLERVTPAGERRSLDAFSTFLSTIPTPKRAKVLFIGSNATGVPRQHAVRGSLRRVFHATAFQVVAQQSEVDVLFFTPDPCWADRPFLFLDQ